jgi:hypothetical protein
VQLHRFVQRAEETFDRVALRRGAAMRLAVGRRPIARLVQPAELPQRVARSPELAHALEQRARPRHVALREAIPHRAEVRPGRYAGGKQCLGLGGEVQRAVRLAQVQGLLAEAVPREQQSLLARVPHGKRERTAQLLHHVLVPVLVGAKEHVLVAAAREAEPVPRELALELAGVGKRAIQDECDAGGRVAQRRAKHRLAARIGVHHALQRLARARAVRERRRHRPERRFVARAARYPACDAGHGARVE